MVKGAMLHFVIKSTAVMLPLTVRLNVMLNFFIKSAAMLFLLTVMCNG